MASTLSHVDPQALTAADPKHKILVLSHRDDSDVLERLSSLFEAERVSTLGAAIEALKSRGPACVLVVGQIPDCSSLDTLEHLTGVAPLLPVIYLDSAMTVAEAAPLIRCGAYNCFSGQEGADELFHCLAEACHEHRRRDRQRCGSRNAAWNQLLVGDSRVMDDVRNTIALIGPRRCTVLITGETGTGKERVARALHAASPRAHLPMVSVNCSAFPDNLLEAELFGHTKGAFTGAANQRVGRFEQAHKSTLFLDEVGEIPIELQGKLLRALQEREIQRLGSSETIPVDLRIIAATNVDLPEKIRQGKFREDLYYRLNVVPLRTPALRQRTSDIPLLVEHFVAKVCRMEGLPTKQVTLEAIKRLSDLPWPGNVRQLENAVEMAIALSGERETLHAPDFGLAPANLKVRQFPNPVTPEIGLTESLDFGKLVNQFERGILEQALLKAGGNKTAAAELLGLKRTTLIMKLRGLQGAGELLRGA